MKLKQADVTRLVTDLNMNTKTICDGKWFGLGNPQRPKQIYC